MTAKDPNCRAAFAAWALAASGRDKAATVQALATLGERLLLAARPMAYYWGGVLRGIDEDDLLQDAWVRFQKRLRPDQKARGRGFPLSLFKTILANRARDLIDRQRVRQHGSIHEVEPGDPKAESPDEAQSRSERELLVRDALERLAAEGAGQAAVDLLWAKHVDQLTASEIADRLGRTTGAVEQALRRARIRFRQALMEAHEARRQGRD